MFEKYFTNETIDKIERIINLIKPKFYNKLTWFVVGTGLTIVSKPLWIEILNAILNKKYQLNITDGNDAFIGLSLVITALIYNLFTVYFDKFLISKQVSLKEEKQINKDKELFNKFLETLPSNDNINFLNNHDFVNPFNIRNMDGLENFVETWSNAETEFMDNKIEDLKKELLVNAEKLIYDLAMGSYIIRNSESMATTIPDMYFGNEYALPDSLIEKIKKLNSLSQKVFDLHQAFIRICREKL